MNSYSDHFYVSKEQLEYEKLTKNLRIFGKGKDDAPIVRDCWEDADDFWAVPRAWGMKNYPGRNKTKRPKCEWVPKMDFTPRHNQGQVIKDTTKILKKSLGCRIEAKTGYGKTVTCLQVSAKFNTPVLVIVDKEDLAIQWEKEFNTWFEGTVGRVQGDNLDYDHPFTVAMAQTLYSRKESLPQKFWKSFGLIIVDEGHSFSAKSFYTSVNKFHARYRLACSATWRRKDELDPLWELSISDQLVIGERTDELRRRYEIVDLKFGFKKGHFIRHWDGQPDFNRILKKLAESEDYNEWLVNKANKLLETRNQVMIVCKRKAQIESLAELLDEEAFGVYAGTYKNKKITEKQLNEATKRPIILATLKKVEKGSDIPSLDTMILASPVSDQEQVIGRTTRIAENKSDCLVIDVRFPEIVFLNGCNRSRDKYYKKLNWERE